MPSLPLIPARLWKIDELVRGDHAHIDISDDCYFLWEWNGADYAESAATNFIGNYKRHPRFRGQNPWWYKEQAIRHAACALRQTVPASWQSNSTFIPVPPSKMLTDPGHDSRLIDTLKLISVDARDLIGQRENSQALEKNISPDDRLKNWEIKDATLLIPAPSHLVVFDDLLSGGSHFAAMKKGLARHFPGVPVSGVFLARRVFPNLAG